MDLQAVLSRLDRLYRERRTDEAQTLLLGAYHQAQEEEDDEARITICNELEGLYRLTGRRDECLGIVTQALELLRQRELTDTPAYATTLLNYATACAHFGMPEQALENYRTVETLYQGKIDPVDYRFASLYNNISQAYMMLGRHADMLASLEKSMEILVQLGGREMEIAISHTNAAFDGMALSDLERAGRHIEQAQQAFDSISYRGVNYDALLSARGKYLYSLGRFEEAAGCFEQLLNRTEETYGRNAAYVGTARNLAAVWRRAGDEEKARHYQALAESAG